jgi:protein tyrosine/serine phosphatase
MGNMEAFLIQDGSYIDASYDEIIKVNGSMSEYISEGLGLTESVLIPLQESLLDG